MPGQVWEPLEPIGAWPGATMRASSTLLGPWWGAAVPPPPPSLADTTVRAPTPASCYSFPFCQLMASSTNASTSTVRGESEACTQRELHLRS